MKSSSMDTFDCQGMDTWGCADYKAAWDWLSTRETCEQQDVSDAKKFELTAPFEEMKADLTNRLSASAFGRIYFRIALWFSTD